MSGWPLVHKQQRILLAHRIGLLDFVEQLARVWELCLKLLFQLVSDLITAILDSRPDRGPHALGPPAELSSHDAETFLDDALLGPPPAGMKGAHDLPFPVHQQNRQAVSRQNGERDARPIRDQSVACKL